MVKGSQTSSKVRKYEFCTLEKSRLTVGRGLGMASRECTAISLMARHGAASHELIVEQKP